MQYGNFLLMSLDLWRSTPVSAGAVWDTCQW